MRSQVKRWGNSASVRIPAPIMAAAGLSLDQAVDVDVADGVVTISRLDRPKYTLDELLAGMTAENGHDEIDWGPPVGNEIW